MLSTTSAQNRQAINRMDVVRTFSLEFVLQPDTQLYQYLADLSPEMPWAVRKTAAQRLGDHGSPEALHGLLEHLPDDPFWMVRCTIIQALERIGDPKAIPTLRTVAVSDGFQVVRYYAAKAVERLT